MSDATRPLTEIDIQRIRDAWGGLSGKRGSMTMLAKGYGLTLYQIKELLSHGGQWDVTQVLAKWNKARKQST